MLASAALEKTSAYGESTADAVAVTVISDDEYARERGWIGAGEPFDAGAIAAGIRERVADIAPDATFRTEVADSDASITASRDDPGTSVRTSAFGDSSRSTRG